MGHIWVDAKLVNPLTDRDEKVSALIDTGTTFTVVPYDLCKKLGLKIVGKKRVETAKGYTELDESFLLLEVSGRSGVTPVLISKELKDVLIGVITLEALGVNCRPRNRRAQRS